MDRRGQEIAIAQASDTTDLLQHIAWNEVVRPRIDAIASNYASLLVEATLGSKVQSKDGQTLGVEQIAGRLYGIRFITQLFEEILRKGGTALSTLEQEVFRIER